MEKYTLIITEKPDAANRIANALDTNGKATRLVESGVPFYQAYRSGDLIVVPALGHLYTVAEKGKTKRSYPTFDYEWVPRHQAEKKFSKTRLWLKVISDLAKNASAFVDACDYDIEGSLIGYCILKFACGNKEQIAKRMKYSTLTKEELQLAFSKLLPNLDFAVIQAGLARHEVDWLYGINLSRALTSAVKTTGHYALLSAGRVQGPTLRFLEERERLIERFVPTAYWTLFARLSINGTDFQFQHMKTFHTQEEAKRILNTCKGKNGQVRKVTAQKFSQNAPFPFDLGTLQSEAYRVFRYTPFRTSNVAQRLYLAALTSYPRTSSQKLPPSINYREILKKLACLPSNSIQALELLSNAYLKPNEGEKVDSAHPAIYPTGNLPEKILDPAEKNIFDLVTRRFMSTFGEPAIRENLEITLDVDGNEFHYDATRSLSEGWLHLYDPYSQKRNQPVPPLVEGETISIRHIILKREFTKPPSRFNPRSLLWRMEKENVGTKATRAGIIQTLSDRKYLCGTDKFSVSKLGFEVVNVLTEFCPNVVSPEMTESLEREMVAIQEGRETKDDVVRKAISILKPATVELKEKESTIGQQLYKAIAAARMKERTLGGCPKCSGGKLIMLRSKKTGKRFVGCSNHFEGNCNATFPLPQKGLIKPSNRKCISCGYPVANVWLKRNHPWKLCLNPSCPEKQGKNSQNRESSLEKQ